MKELKTNTAHRIVVGPLVDPTDGKTAEVALTVTGILVEIYHEANDGGAVVRVAFNPTASGGDNDMVHITDDTAGMYDLELTAAQLNWLGTGRLTLYDVDGFLVHWEDLLVVSAQYWDAKYGTGNFSADVKAISGDATAADTLELFVEALDQVTGQLDSGTLHDDTITAASINTGALTADAFAADAIVAATLATGAITDDAFAANAITNAAVADDVDVNVKTITAGAITATAIADAAIDNATFAADVGSTAYATNIIALAVRKVLDEINLDHLAAVATAGADMTTEVVDNSIISRVIGNGDTSTFVPSTDGLHAAGVDLDAILADTGELQTDWHDGGRLDLILDAAGSAGDPWATAIPGAYGAGTAGLLLGTTIPTAIADIPTVAEFTDRTLPAADYTVVSDLGTVQTGDSYAIVNGDHGLVSIQDDIDEVLADTNELQTDLKDTGRLDALIDAIKAKTDNLPVDPADESLLEAAILAAHAVTDGKVDTNGVDINSVLTNQTHIMGGGFATGTDSLKILSDVLDALGTKADNLALAVAAVDGTIGVNGVGLTAITDSTDLITSARMTELDIATAGKVAFLIRKIADALVNKLIVRNTAGGAGEDVGDAEMFNDASASLGTIDKAFADDGTFTTRKRLVI